LNGGVNHIDNPATYTVEDSVVLKAPTKTGYDFAGWTEGNTIDKGSTGDKTFTAQWTATVYSITYELNSGVNHAGNPVTYTVESSTVTLQAPDRNGYTFNGWVEGESAIPAGSTGNKTFTAQWTATPYTVNYTLDGGENHADNPATYTIEDSVTLQDPNRTGFIFDGWAEGSSIPAGSTGDRTFTAQWKCVEANIEEIVIDGMNIAEAANDSIFEYTVKECEESSVSLDLGASSQANVTVDGETYAPGTEITLTGDVTTVNIQVESETGDSVKNYKLNIAAPLTGNLYYQRWNDVIAVNQNPATNGGHNVSDIRWYNQDGSSAGNGEYVVVSGNESIDNYYTEIKTVETNAWHRVCATEETKSVEKVTAYPNPVPRGEKVTLQLPESFTSSVLNIYSITGALVKSGVSLPAKSNSIDVSEHVPGIYLLQIIDKTGTRQTVRIIIE
jgi:uncharacterized repeat protein (TIGR02543 family)